MSSKATGAIAERYAMALFELAEEQSALDAVAADLATLKGLLTGSEDLRRLVRSPVISREDKDKAIAAVAAYAQLGKLVGNFLGLVAKNRRLFALDGMIDAYLATLASRRGEVTAQVVSAAPLDQAQLDQLSEVLRRAVGRKVSISPRVDPAILGGLVVKVGSRMVDSSLGTKLQQLKIAMKGVA